MIASANTVIDPWAVMIKPLYTLVTYAAMAWSLRPNDLAVGTQQHGVEVLKHSEKWDIIRLLKVARVPKGADHEQQEGHSDEAWVNIEPQVAIRGID